MNQNRNSQERDDNHQDAGRGPRNFQNRPSGSVQLYPNLNPNYQNPVDLVHHYNNNRQLHEPEENIYERLDDDDDENVENNVEVGRNEVQNNQNNADHTYERIDDRYSCSGRTYSRCYRYHILNHIAIPNFLNDAESRNLSHYDQPRQIYLDSSRLSSQFCQTRLGRLGRNCFSTENIAYASTGRTIYPLGYNCMCWFCRHLDTKYCHYCHNIHNRLRYQDGLASNSRHYIYQLQRNCKCPFCRGEYSYVKLPITSCRHTESLRMECHCRSPNNSSCRCKILSNCNSATQIGRYLDWINRAGPSVNNPLYATIHVGRPCPSALGNVAAGGNLPNSIDPGPSTSNVSASTINESNTSSNSRPMFSPSNPSTSHASLCSTNRSAERQHTCDDSCIRNHSGNITGISQFLGRCERAECNHGRLSVHWWFINKWLPPWNPHHFDRNMDTVPPMEEEPQDQHESDSDDA
ncbi:uncharacterized protein LOC143187093 [Calliopsis andreniformis]|uniref:uncharacterized protein LOC143187093 n=1 Tax=Calliopsis andreniformis TaxID=337506 RepID=UPI003FCD2DB9